MLDSACVFVALCFDFGVILSALFILFRKNAEDDCALRGIPAIFDLFMF
jgi:hypothetical protein